MNMPLTVAAKDTRVPLQTDDYLGPASVVAVDGELRVELPEGAIVPAEPAFAVPYAPAPGDLLLVIARGAACYALGVLHGTGRTVLSLPGDVEVRAEGGRLRLVGERGVEVHGPEVELHAGKLKVVAGAVVQAFESLVQKVTGLVSARAKEFHVVAEEGAFTKAKHASLLTEETVSINGKQVHLG